MINKLSLAKLYKHTLSGEHKSGYLECLPDCIINAVQALSNCLYKAILIHTPLYQYMGDPGDLLPPVGPLVCPLVPQGLQGPGPACYLYAMFI